MLTFMKVLAVDPGYDRLGVAVVEKQNGTETLLFSGCIQTDKQADLSVRIHDAGKVFAELLKKHRPDAVGIETLFFNKNQKTAIGVAQMRGVILYLAHEAGAKIYEFGPQEIKVATTGYGNSDKTAMIAMVKRLVKNAPAEALDDEYDAIAVAITTLAHMR
jgi:crossover junction endodeoxyribonuclease RuvC